MKKYILPIIILMTLCTAQITYSLSFEQIGPNSTLPYPMGIQPGMTKGIFDIINLESRVYSIDTNGNTNYYFKATIEEINKIINLFSKVAMRDHIVQIRSDKGTTKTFSGIEIGYNVKLQVVGGLVLFSIREEQKEDFSLEPCLTILTGGDNKILDKMKWPENIIIENFIPESTLKSKRQKPQRNYYYGLLEFADGAPPVEFVTNVNSRITLWQQDQDDGINIGDINNQGYFTIPLSDEELANLKSSKSFLTVTIANSLTEVKKTDVRFPAEMLTKDKTQVKPVKVQGPAYYYGRILFEDDSPAILDSSLWKGAEIWVDFPYSGMAHLDSEGYFKVNLTQEQYEKAKTDRVRNNIVVPDSQQTNTSRAMYVFPITELSQDKSKAGVVKIPRPKPPKQELITVESKVGQSIPGFENIKIADFQSESVENKSLLICFWDMEQHPSRQFIQELQKQKETLKNKSIEILIIHAGTKAENEVKQWIEQNEISLISGTIEEAPYDTLLAWGARGLPWLILTDKKHVITKAGFNTDDPILMN